MYGENNVEVAVVLDTIASNLYDAGRFNEALNYYKQELNVRVEGL